MHVHVHISKGIIRLDLRYMYEMRTWARPRLEAGTYDAATGTRSIHPPPTLRRLGTPVPRIASDGVYTLTLPTS